MAASCVPRPASEAAASFHRSDCGAAAEGLELRVLYYSFLADPELELHDIAALLSTHDPGPDRVVALVHAPHVAGILVVVDHFITVGHGGLRSVPSPFDGLQINTVLMHLPQGRHFSQFSDALSDEVGVIVSLEAIAK